MRVLQEGRFQSTHDRAATGTSARHLPSHPTRPTARVLHGHAEAVAAGLAVDLQELNLPPPRPTPTNGRKPCVVLLNKIPWSVLHSMASIALFKKPRINSPGKTAPPCAHESPKLGYAALSRSRASWLKRRGGRGGAQARPVSRGQKAQNYWA